jgi:hypothetical protein
MINDLAICAITIDDAWWKFYVLSNLPNDSKWRNFVSTLELTKQADTVPNITFQLRSFEHTLRRAKGLSHDAALFVTKKGGGRTSMGDCTKGECRGQKSQGIMCHGRGEKGHIKPKCRNKDQWAPYGEKKSKVDGNLTSTELTPAPILSDFSS